MYHDLETWRRYMSAAGFAELTHYYRPAGLPREANYGWSAYGGGKSRRDALVNINRARIMLGLDIPPQLLAGADEVIE